MSDLEELVGEALRRSAESVATKAVIPDPASVRRHRSALRRRARLAASAAVVLVLAVAIALPLVFVSIQGSGRLHPTTPTTTTVKHGTSPPSRRPTMPTVDLAATPRGWVPVDYRKAQISVPRTWTLAYDTACDFQTRSGTVFVGRTDYGFCPSYVLKGTEEVLLEPYSSAGGSGTWLRVDGIPVRRVFASADESSYEVPALGVNLLLQGTKAQAVLRTLTFSPRAVALAKGPAPAVPKSWKRLEFHGISLAVPGSWPVERTDTYPGIDDAPCGPFVPGAMLGWATSRAVLAADEYAVSYNCPAMGTAPSPVRAARDGLVVNDGRLAPAVTMSGSSCRESGGLLVCPQAGPDDHEFGVLVVGVAVSQPVSGPAKPAEVSIGLAGNGLIARTILSSLEAVPAG